MASAIAPIESSSHKPQWKYDVFLSFRGEDTRQKFTDHLYDALYRKGIVTYRDDPSLEKGENISGELLKAIENSKYLVVIISRNYASSTWCLEEHAKIMECVKGGEQMAIPIFYDVDPSHVRKQKGSFEEAFVKHEKDFKDNLDKVRRWRNAMNKIAFLSGWDSQDRPSEVLFIRDIVKDLQNKLSNSLPCAPENLVGMESRMEDMLSHLSLGSDDVRIIGISGMAGIGKSTLARAIFDEISAQFECCSFLENVKEVTRTGSVALQKKLLFDIIQEKDLIKDGYMGKRMIEGRLNARKVLVVLDDAKWGDQTFLPEKSCFGRGSRIIITTTDEHVLNDVDFVYKAKELSKKDAKELFFSKAFGENNITKEFKNLSVEFIKYARGHPLALIVLGRSLRGKDVIQWQSALAKLREYPNKEIFATLRLGFDELDETEKAIFLDIVFFFIGKEKDYVMEILDCCGFYPEIGVQRLLEKSLLTVTNNKFMVHDLLQRMAYEVVKQESPKEPGKRSRLKDYHEIRHVTETNRGTKRIEGIISVHQISPKWKAGCFTKMTNLRLLEVRDTISNSGLEYLSNNLRLLKWEGFPSSTLPASFLPESIYELSLRRSSLRQLWTGQKNFPKLKMIDLSGSKHLTGTPDFSLIPNLEKLILGACEKLYCIHPSIGVLQHLKFLDLSGCKNLREIPPNIGNLKSLKVLHLDGCSNLKELPDSIWSLECLEELSIRETAVARLPPELTNLKNLKVLSCRGCNRKRSGLLQFLFRQDRVTGGMSLPLVSGLSSLEELDIIDCQLEEGGIPNDLGCLSSLRKLYLSGNHFSSIPESISQIPQLEWLKLNYCENLRELPRLPDSILFVRVTGCMKLSSISNPFIICRVGERIALFNCMKLLPRDLEIPLVQKYSLALLCYIIGCSVFPDKFGETYAVAPNYEIPNWFTYQKVGSLFSFRIRDQGFTSKGRGFAICVSFLRQEQEGSEPQQVTCSDVDLICGFNVGGNQFGPSFRFPIRFVTSNSVWMGFVPLNVFPDDTKWEEMIDKRIDVSLWTLNDRLKIIKCGISPLQQGPHDIRKIIRSACSSPEDLSSIFHELRYQEVDYDFSSSSDKEEREDHHEIPIYAIPCGFAPDQFWPIPVPYAAPIRGVPEPERKLKPKEKDGAISYLRAWF